jgi:hypothetical protein
MLPGMVLRVLLYAAYALLGAVLSYGAVYLFSPMGFAIVAAAILLVTTLPRGLERLGLLAGPGILLLLTPLAVIGAVIVAAALGTYAVTGRRRCVA